jgi:hydroxymethylglutaryl-CoA synthase
VYDRYKIALTSSYSPILAVAMLMEKHKISGEKIGRIEVGTETIQDKSKSVKSYLMQLFPSNPDICGVDNVNACYGGTAALLNTVAWIESEDWDGRLALVVVGDIAVYTKGPARPTGGAAAMAMLIGPNAPLVVERGTAAHYMQHAFDFYKPNPSSEYPIVDGQVSISCYLKALDACYNAHLDKIAKKTGKDATLESFDYFVFHSPYSRLVQKSMGRLFFNDALRNPETHAELQPYRDVIIETTYTSRELDSILCSLSSDVFKTKTLLTRMIPAEVGNSYCASLFSGLLSLICHLREEDDCVGRRIGMFAYGSGLAATMFSLKIVAPLTNLTPTLEEIQTTLSKRQKISPIDFEKVLADRELRYCQNNWNPQCPPKTLRSGTFYLETVDEKFRRFYNRMH